MQSRGCRGEEHRRRLRTEFQQLSAQAKGVELQMLLETHQIQESLIETATVMAQELSPDAASAGHGDVLPTYKGCGTMLMYSGRFSLIDDAVVMQLLHDEGAAVSVQELVQHLQSNPAVKTLWDEFLP